MTSQAHSLDQAGPGSLLLPHRILDCVVTADGHELVLSQRGDVFRIDVDRYELMVSRGHGSEDALASLAIAALGSREAPRVLVGGLGMGFTLRAALDALAGQPNAVVEVAEVFEAVVTWNRGPLAPLAARPLDDSRVRVLVADVGEVIASREAAWDAVLLDVDNGAEALTLESNARLYTPRGLARLRAALAPEGVVAFWSSDEDPRFAHRLGESGFAGVETHRVRARAGKGARHVVFLARRD
jgi:spermidine synthase